MPRSWPIWFAFTACLIAVATAVAWLSMKVIEADRAEAIARQQETLEENARLALWRMEAATTALVAQESARPPIMYRSFVRVSDVPAKAAKSKQSALAVSFTPSPLLEHTLSHILIHFEIDDAGNFSSPQVPVGASRASAVPTYLSIAQLGDNDTRAQHLQALLKLPELLAELPPAEAPLAEALQAGVDPLASSPTQPPPIEDDPFATPPDSPEPPQPVAPAPQQVAQQFAQQAPAPQMQQSAVPQQKFGQRAEGGINANPFNDQTTTSEGTTIQAMRGQGEFEARQRFNRANQQAGLQQNAIFSNTKNINVPESMPDDTQLSAMTPRWIDGHLLLLRRVVQNGRTMVQGCELDWPSLEQDLLNEISDLLSHARIEPLTGADESAGLRRLAALPVKLVPGPLPLAASAGFSKTQLSLALTWGAVGLAVLAAAALLRGVIALGERRAAFVSAVTHELRTPLTTFRMYAEMLSEGMVTDEQSRRDYLRTLRVEADRLTHLVANVLAYARLERGRPGGRLVPQSVSAILDVAIPRLTERASEGHLNLVIEAAPEVLDAQVVTDSAAVEQILFNLVDNACKYAASAENRTLELSATKTARRIELCVRDHGPGISAAQRRWLFQPFRKSARDAAHSAPGVGLGLALCRRLARDLGGDLCYQPAHDGAGFVLALPGSV